MNRPLIEYQIEILKRAGIDKIVLSLSYQPDKIQHLLGLGHDLGVELDYVTEPQPMGTGGAYRFAAERLEGPTIVLNGDVLTDLIVSKMIKHHQASGAYATVALTEVEDPLKYGVVTTGNDGEVTGFHEKPSSDEMEHAGSNFVNAGIYILEPEILELVPEGQNYSFEYNVFPDILQSGMPFGSFVLDKYYWCDIGTPENYLAAHMDFLEGKVRNFPVQRNSEFDRATSTFIDQKSLIGPECVIKPNVTITNSVLGRGIVVEERAVIENSVIWSHSRISNSAEISGAVLARSCYIGKNSIITPGTVLGNKSSLTDYTKA